MNWSNFHCEWVTRNFLDNREHVFLIRQLMAAHCLCEASNRLVVQPNLDVKEYTLNSALHWSRVFEWPWALMNGLQGPKIVALDAGGGHGVFQHVLASRVGTVYNIDTDRRALDFAEAHLMKRGNLHCQQHNILRMPFHNGFFDQVYCISVLEHIQDWWNAFQELVRVTKPGGRLILTIDVLLRKGTASEDNFFISLRGAKEILNFLGGAVPDHKGGIQVCANNLTTGEQMLCLCIRVDKGGVN